jgi:alpha/beta superfamily hydrolase
MKPFFLALASLLVLAACNKDENSPQNNSTQSNSSTGGSQRGDAPKQTLAEARHGFKTTLVSMEKNGQPAPTPPAGMFRLVHYKSPAGELAAYLTASPKDKKKHPAIVWIVGGMDNSIDDFPWRKAKPENDQTADAFWRAGIITLYPSFRGGNDNPGVREGFYGEVDDALAAADFLAKQDGVDPHRIYLGGHRMGGTLALLAAAASAPPDRFRAVFAFGAIDDVSNYKGKLPFDTANSREVELRSPIHWLHSIRCPVFAFAGTRGNLSSLQAMSDASHNPLLHFEPVAGVDQYGILGRVTPLVAEKIVADDGPNCNIAFTQDELHGHTAP